VGAGYGAGAYVFARVSRDKRWSSWGLLVQTFLIAVALTYAYVIGLALGAVALAALYAAMERSGSSRA